MASVPSNLVRSKPLDYQPAVQFHFLGRMEYGEIQTLQARIAKHLTERETDEMVLLMGEQTGVISIGRSGSRRDIELTDDELKERGLILRWERRGGPAVLHQPGQLAVYPVVPLVACGWTVGAYLRRLQAGIRDALRELRVACDVAGDTFHLVGRNGLVAALGIAVRDGIATGGAWINVNPAMSEFRHVRTFANASFTEKPTMGCLVAERQGIVTMSAVRAALVPALAAAFERPHYYLHTGHPWASRHKDKSRARAR